MSRHTRQSGEHGDTGASMFELGKGAHRCLTCHRLSQRHRGERERHCDETPGGILPQPSLRSESTSCRHTATDMQSFDLACSGTTTCQHTMNDTPNTKLSICQVCLSHAGTVYIHRSSLDRSVFDTRHINPVSAGQHQTPCTMARQGHSRI